MTIHISDFSDAKPMQSWVIFYSQISLNQGSRKVRNMLIFHIHFFFRRLAVKYSVKVIEAATTLQPNFRLR